MKKIIVTLFLLTMAVTAQAQEDLVRIGIVKISDRGALWYMEKLADKYGFRASYSVYPTPGDAAKAVAKGDVDIAAPGLGNAISLRSQGKPIVVIAGFSKGGLTVVGRKDLGLTTFLQLKGRKVGLIKGSNADLSFLGMLEKYKLSYSEQPGKDIQILYGKSYPALSAALLTKNIVRHVFPIHTAHKPFLADMQTKSDTLTTPQLANRSAR
ncbi:MAG: ABC transporter substrate-binding protein [Chlorobiales bacterium]|nr:ABC transporter substrate-binding protein [Chlorobiales bacterium]